MGTNSNDNWKIILFIVIYELIEPRIYNYVWDALILNKFIVNRGFKNK